MNFHIEIANVFNELCEEEQRVLFKFLETFNSKKGNSNNYIDTLNRIKKGWTETPSHENMNNSVRKSHERLFLKIYEALGLDFNIHRPRSFSNYERGKVLIQKYLLYGQIAISRENSEHYVYFLRRALKVAIKWEQFDSAHYISKKLVLFYRYYGFEKNAQRFEKQKENIESLNSDFEYLHDILSKYNNSENETPPISSMDKQRIQDIYSSNTRHVRLRKLSLYSYLSLNDAFNGVLPCDVSRIGRAFSEVVELIKSYPSFSTEKELPIATFNFGILKIYGGELQDGFNDMTRSFEKLHHHETLKNLLIPKIEIVRLLLGKKMALTEESTERNKYNFAVYELLNGQSSISLLSLLYRLELHSPTNFYIRVYQILGFIIKLDYDEADRMIGTFKRTPILKGGGITCHETNIKNLLILWRERGFNKEISDLPEELVAPIRHHYENTWNPLSADLIPIHLWKKKEGIPNYKDAYAKLFAHKRRLARCRYPNY